MNDRYDSKDRLVNRQTTPTGAGAGGQIMVVYDGDGQRVRKTVGGVMRSPRGDERGMEAPGE